MGRLTDENHGVAVVDPIRMPCPVALMQVGSLDLRDPATRDALLRAIWRKLRPEEPEPISAPQFWGGRGTHSARWRISDMFDEEYCWRPAETDWCYADAFLPALADVPLDSPDCDLLALRAIALAVLAC